MPRKKVRSRRRRGVILSLPGWQRLREAQEQSELHSNGGRPYTLEELNEITGLSPKTLTKVRTRKTPVDRQTLDEYFNNFNLTLTPNDYQQPGVELTKDRQPVIPIEQDWGEAPDVSVFYDRIEELEILEQWIVSDRDRLVGIVGMGGIGKTALAVKLAQQIQNQFEYVIWRSLRNAPYLETLLGELVSCLSAGQEIKANIDTLLEYFRDFRCLVILDNLETILVPEKSVGTYRTGYENYGQLWELIGETPHSSCLLLTSREKPVELATLEGIDLSVRSLQLKGSPKAAQGFIQAKGLSGSTLQQQQLCDRYDNNPLALKLVATSIQDLFNGQIEAFLAQNISVFSNIEQLLEQQFIRLSPLEQSIMYWLTINREWTSITELADDIIPPVSKAELLGALQSLSWRSLIETQAGSYTQQPVVIEYVTALLLKEVARELLQQSSALDFFSTYPLIKATAKDYVRESQIRLILKPTASQLGANLGSAKAIEQQLQKILQSLRSSAMPLSGYGGGNLINLVHHLQIDLTNYDFSGLRIWQAYLQGVNLQQVNFAAADFAKSVFTQTFGSILSLAFSPDGQFLATGDTKGEIHLWQVTPPRSLMTFQGHSNWVLSLAWSPDGNTLASSSYEQNIRLWQPHTGECTKTLMGHSNWVLSLAWSSDSNTLASSGDD
ncbi:MAG: NB-ARC domain-containing protein, partial [Cyanobacteria bacterium P01_G01_bin.67]